MKGILVQAIFILFIAAACGNEAKDQEPQKQPEKPLYDSSDLKDLDISSDRTQIKTTEFNTQKDAEPPVIKNRKAGDPLNPEELGRILPTAMKGFKDEPVSYGIRKAGERQFSNAGKQFYNIEKKLIINFSITDTGGNPPEDEYNYYGEKPEFEKMKAQELEGRFENLRYKGYMIQDIPEGKVYLRLVLADRYLVQIDANKIDMYGPAIMELATKPDFEKLSK